MSEPSLVDQLQAAQSRIAYLERELRVLEIRANQIPPSEPAVLRPAQQTCNRCGSVDGITYQVPDKLWESVCYPEWSHEVKESILCLACFDDLATEKGVQYLRYLTRVVFTGRTSSCRLKIKEVQDTQEATPSSLGEEDVQS